MKAKPNKVTLENPQSTFDTLSELRAMAYLFGNFGRQSAQMGDSEMETVGHGIALILERVHRNLETRLHKTPID